MGSEGLSHRDGQGGVPWPTGLWLGMTLWVRVMCKLCFKTHQHGLSSRGNSTLTASVGFLGWIFVIRVPTHPPVKAAFAFVKGRTASILVQDRAVYTEQFGACARPSPCGLTVTQKEDPYSTSTVVDSFKLLLRRNLR